MSIKEIPEGITPEQAAVVLARPLAAHVERVLEYSGPDVDLGREE
jgi:hypothetical protein